MHYESEYYMTNTALVTGASSGIGVEFARYHASKGGDLIITARREAELQRLKSELETKHGVTVHVVALDLGASGGAEALHKAVQETGEIVKVLINNAGFGGHGVHIERQLSKEQAMIDLNIKAVVSLTHMIGNDMVKSGGGKMLHVSSTAGFMPGPMQAVYFASKAFVTSFSQAIDQELRGRGVTSTALCPGGVATEFLETANLEHTQMGKASGSFATAESCAKHGYDAMMKGTLVTVNQKSYSFFVNWVFPLMSRRWALKMIADMQSEG
jgi:short-subunit dehydrogenase|tara:strand:+ start:905 stop:1714 length:810 start_codon:yes stop_codon:yes gene_type:complete